MDETTEFLKNTLPELDTDRVEFLASHLVTLNHHNHLLDRRGKDYEKEYTELKQMFDATNESLKRSLEIEEHMQKRNISQQDIIKQLRNELEKLRNASGHHEFNLVPGVMVQRLSTNTGPTLTTSQCLDGTKKPSSPSEETNVKNISQEVSRLHDDIQKKEFGIRTIQDKYNQSQKAIREYKKKLGLPPDATHAEIERKITEIKSQNLELKNAKTFLRREVERSAVLQRDLKESHRKLEHLRLKLQHKELKLKQLEVQSGMTTSSHLTYQTVPVIPIPQPMRQCQECTKPIQPIMLCDLCTAKRLSIK